METSFQRRFIDVQIALQGQDPITLSNFRTSFTCTITGLPAASSLKGYIYNLPKATMDNISLAGTLTTAKNQSSNPTILGNQITLLSGSSPNNQRPDQMQMVFVGDIFQATADLSTAPDVRFFFQASTIYNLQTKNFPDTSYKGNVSLDWLLRGIARQAGLRFTNHDVDIQLSNPHYTGNATQQIELIAREYNLVAIIDNGELAIWKQGSFRSTQQTPVPLISAQTGMIGMPVYSTNMVKVSLLYRPDIKIGQQVQLQSHLKMNTIGNNTTQDLTQGMQQNDWYVSSITHYLETEQSKSCKWQSNLILSALPPGK